MIVSNLVMLHKLHIILRTLYCATVNFDLLLMEDLSDLAMNTLFQLDLRE